MIEIKYKEKQLADDLSPAGYVRSQGLKFPFDTDLLSTKQIRLLRQGNYEAKETSAVTGIVREADTVFELGAGMGYMSTLCAKLLGAKFVVAVEANPLMIPYINRVHAANGVKNVKVINALMGPQDADPKPFYIRDEFVASSLTKHVDNETSNVIAEKAVPVKSANKVINEHNPTILVCDIEGAEVDVIPAMDLTGFRACVVELHPQWIGNTGVQQVFDAMAAAGLSYFPRYSVGKVVTFRRSF